MRLSHLMPCLVSAALLAAVPVTAQTPPAADPVARLRQDFEARARAATASLNEYYERALGNVEASLVASGDYEQARAVKLRRDELAASKSGPMVAASTGYTLSPDVAKLTGVVAKSGELQGWRTATCAADWTLSKLPPGNYRLELSYSMDDLPAPTSTSGIVSTKQAAAQATFSFRELTLLAGASKNTRPITIESNKGVMTPLQVPGTLELTRMPVTLRLASTTSYPLNTIVFKDLKLMPVTNEAVPSTAGTAPTNLADEFKKLQETQSARLLASRKPLVDAYLAQLATLAATAKDDAADAIEAEQRRAGKLAALPAPSKANAMGLDGYEDISDVHYVADVANTGDRFKVERNGEQFLVRLAWIAAPPVELGDKRVLKAVMDRFNIDETVALLLGSSAREFTELYLQSRPLRMLVRSKKNKSEAMSALVFVEDIGLFQNVLIDNGLAVADAPANAIRGGVESALIKSLQEREDAAKKHQPPQGGWALRTNGGKP